MPTLKNAAAGNAHYFHHLAGFFSDTEEDPVVEAPKWARRDLELRHSIAAEDAFAWALYRGGDFAHAAEVSEKCSPGASGPRISSLTQG
jgi:hypothetical protein